MLPACELVSGLGDLEVDPSLGGGGSSSDTGAGDTGGAGAGGTGATGTGAAGASGGQPGGGGMGGTPCSPGALGEPCCDGACQVGAACDVSTCVACGALGEPCCEAAQEAACDANRTCGAGSVCEGCVSTFDSGSQHRCAVRTDGTIWCWGLNISGELGQSPSFGVHPTPVEIAGLAGQVNVLEGEDATCAIKNDGTLECWGANHRGEVGDGTLVDEHPTLGAVTTLGNTVTAVGAIGDHMCATSGGTNYCWGANDWGELGFNLGDGIDYNLPQAVPLLPAPMVSFGGGSNHSCGVDDQGAAWCWGKSDHGALGFPAVPDGFSYAPNHPAGLDTGVATLMEGGWYHNCAIKTDKTLWCWGENYSGELGDPLFAGGSRVTPTQVADMGAEVEDAAGGNGFTCALKTDGTVWCWGWNNEGQLGRGNADFQDHPLPVQVTLPALAQNVEAGYASACAHLVDGRIMCWGRNLFGQSGVGGDPMLSPNEVLFVCP